MGNNSVSYKCPQCGAPLSFLPGQDHVTCEYCGAHYTVQEIEQLFAAKESEAARAAGAGQSGAASAAAGASGAAAGVAAGVATGAAGVAAGVATEAVGAPGTAAAAVGAADTNQAGGWKTEAAGTQWEQGETEQFQTFVCSSCGAELMADGNTMATECCYCGNPTMIPQRFQGTLKPDFILPFKKTKEEAKAALKEFYKGKKLLPDAFTSNNRIDAIQGLYVPFWLFDSKVHAQADYEASNTTTYVDGNDDVRETEYYNCYREGHVAFKKIPVDGSKKMQDDYMDSVEPFDYEAMQPFTTAYLTGYLADKYDVTAKECAARADSRVEESAKELLNGTLNYDNYNMLNSQFEPIEGSVSYAMAPVWILTTRFEGKPYTFMMNGQTGKFVGSLPIDKAKEKKYTALAFVISLVVAIVLANLASKFF